MELPNTKHAFFHMVYPSKVINLFFFSIRVEI